ncbi:MAG: electron transport complex subunit RsxC [Gammaproteobacteria bacterium]|nr:MAG: electron transport complex subunit RsxC [Gammaproteobacteria bacterium]
MGLFGWLRHGKFEHGIHPPEYKDEIAQHPIRRLPFAPDLILPLAQHIGTPAKAIVKPGQEVVRGEVIAEADGFLSAPLHAPATGIIKTVDLTPGLRGNMQQSIVLHVYQSATQEVLCDSPREMDQLTPQEIIQAVQDTGMVGLGGAAFPTHVKYNVPKEHQVDTLLVNGCECEPFLSTDHRVMLEHPNDLIQGIHYAMRATGTSNAVIGIESNKRNAAQVIEQNLAPDDPIRVEVVETKYPQGAEKMLLKSALGLEVPAGGLPSEIGVVVSNAGTLAQLGVLLPRGQGLIERVITVAGNAVNTTGNFLVPIGTPVRFILDYLGVNAEVEEIVLGGPMMGMATASLDVPVTKGTSGILVFKDYFLDRKKTPVYPCIKCARCVEACPMHLNPAQLGWLAAKREYEKMEQEFHLNDCFECGCCSYVCPSNIPLVQHFRVAKTINREMRQKVA